MLYKIAATHSVNLYFFIKKSPMNVPQLYLPVEICVAKTIKIVKNRAQSIFCRANRVL